MDDFLRVVAKLASRSGRLAPTAVTACIVAVAFFLVCGLVACPASAADSEGVPPRITAVLPYGQGCVASSRRTVGVASAEQKILNPAQAWQLAQGQGVTVAVLDTGAAVANSVQLSGQVLFGPNEITRRSADHDCVGHGTFIAGLIAARRRVGTTVVGIAPEAQVDSIVVADDRGATSPDVIAKGIMDAVKAGIRIILVSAVSPQSSSALRHAVATARAHSCLVIAPVTADDQSTSGPAFPAALDGVLTVGNSAALTDTASGQSNASATPAALLAPGDSLLSVGPGGGVFIGSGAAYSSAIVAGTAALVLSYRPALTTAQLIHRLVATAYPTGVVYRGEPSSGIIDPYAAVSTILPEEAGREPITPLPTTGTVLEKPGRPSSSRRSALVLGGTGVALLLLVLVTVATGHRGRERNWRPGTRGDLSSPKDK